MKIPPTSTKPARTTRRQTNIKQEPEQILKKQQQNEVLNQIVCAACLFETNIDSEEYCSTECKHHYHEKCLTQWLKKSNTCCLCRQKIAKYTSKANGEIVVPERNLISRFIPTFSVNQNTVNLYFVPEHGDSELEFFSARENYELNFINLFIVDNDNRHLLDEPLLSAQSDSYIFSMGGQNNSLEQIPLIEIYEESNVPEQRRPPSRQSKRKNIRKAKTNRIQNKKTTKNSKRKERKKVESIKPQEEKVKQKSKNNRNKRLKRNRQKQRVSNP